MPSFKHEFKTPVKIPNSCLKQYLNAGNKKLYDYCLEDPKQILEHGDEVQKGLVKCIWAVLQERPSSTFKDVNHSKHPLKKCLDCKGYNLKCEGYKFPYYRLEELREYNKGLKSK